PPRTVVPPGTDPPPHIGIRTTLRIVSRPKNLEQRRGPAPRASALAITGTEGAPTAIRPAIGIAFAQWTMRRPGNGTARVTRISFSASHQRCTTRFVVACLVVALGSPASAQYFGRNKVRYRAFDFQVMQTEHFDIYFYPSEREGVEIAARVAERWYTRLQRLVSHAFFDRQPPVVYASHSYVA